jgi:DNA-binding CsgD family transcriptional regulator
MRDMKSQLRSLASQETICVRTCANEVPDLDLARNEIRTLNDDLKVLSRPFPGRELLTPREKVVLAQIVKGTSSKAVARVLRISRRTVDFHRANIIQKLGARNTVELVHKVLGSDAASEGSREPLSS